MKLLFLLLLLSSSVMALKPHTVTYTLSISDFEIANETRTLSKKDDVYHYAAHAKTSGFARLIKDYQIDAESSFVINKFGVQPTHYKLLERDGKKVKKDIDIQLSNQQIDPLSLPLALTQALERNPAQTDFYFSVNNGKKVKQHHYQQVKYEDKNLIKIIRPGKQFEAYFAKDKNYLAVLIKRKKLTYRLKSN